MQKSFILFGLYLVGLTACGQGGTFTNNSGLGSSNSSGVDTVVLSNCDPMPKQALSEEPFLAAARDVNGNVIASATLQFQSSHPEIADVSNNTLQARYPGKTTIVAVADGVASQPCDITVAPPKNNKQVKQLTNNDDEDDWGQNNNWSTTSRGDILWQHVESNGDIDIILGDILGNASILKTVSSTDVDFMALGSGSGKEDILASWREGLSTTFVSNGIGTPPSLGMHSQEENSIADGCLFFRQGQPDNDILNFTINGGLTPTATAGDLFGPITSECQAVYELQQNGTSSLVYFDGAKETPIVGGLPLFSRYDFRSGKIVFAKGGDVFLYDTSAANPQIMNITNDPGSLNNFPKTDGHSIVFVRNAGGVSDVVLYDIASGASQILSLTTGPKDGNSLELDLKQAIWMEGSDLYFYDGSKTALLDPAPALNVNQPHLRDGIVAWYGATNTTFGNEIFILK